MKKFLIGLGLISMGSLTSPTSFAEGLSAKQNEQIRKEAEDEVDALSEAFGLDETSTEQSPTDNPDQADRPRPRPGPCGKIKLDDTQKAKLREAFFTQKNEQIALHAKHKIAHNTYAHAVLGNAERANADTAANGIASSKKKMVASRVNFETGILYDILTVEQRKPGFMCLMLMHKRHHEGHPRPHPRPQPEPRP